MTPTTAAPDHEVTCRPRVQALQSALPALGVDALLVSNPKDIEYLTGFSGHDSLLLLGSQAAVIISDTRYDTALDPWRQGGFAAVVMGVRHRLEATVAEQSRSFGSIGVQSEHLTVLGHRRLAEAVGAAALVETTAVLAALRMRKDEAEIASIEKAIRIQQEALAAALGALRPGMSEGALNALIDFEMRSRGARGASFDGIVAAGSNSALPHHESGATPVGPGVLLVDWGAAVDGYCGDLTRTFAVGRMPPEIAGIYEIVLEAQEAAIAAAAPGRTCAAIDAVARDRITAAGYGEQFNHGLGHGLGKDVHEAPYFNSLGRDVRLEPGMVMTVEPGIYLPGIGGVRIEDDIVITAEGCRVLSDYPKGLDTAVLDL